MTKCEDYTLCGQYRKTTYAFWAGKLRFTPGLDFLNKMYLILQKKEMYLVSSGFQGPSLSDPMTIYSDF